MQKKITYVLIFIVAILFYGCAAIGDIIPPTQTPIPTLTPTLSPKEVYAEQMEKVVPMLHDYLDNTLRNWGGFLENEIDDQGTTYADLTQELLLVKNKPELLGLVVRYELETDDLQELYDEAQKVVDDAYDLSVELGGASVPVPIQVPHQTITECVKGMQYHPSLVINILSSEFPNQSDLEQLRQYDCQNVDLAVEKWLEYIDKNLP